MDIAQFLNNISDTLETGDVVVIADKQPMWPSASGPALFPEVDVSDRSYDTRVCGVVSHVGIDQLGLPAKQSEKAKTKKNGEKTAGAPQRTHTIEELAKIDHTKINPGQKGFMVTLGAFAHCKVDADIAPIKAGDLLTTSHTKGHAQKVIDPSKAVGAIVGKSLGNLKKGKGKIAVLVMLQ
ncbi:MAG: hypothetical protein P0120_17895 [Nitrospira sp.]|nr:hypothetical protein [Nitrospira sp.]